MKLNKEEKLKLIKSQLELKNTELKKIINEHKNNVKLFEDNLDFVIDNLELNFKIEYRKWDENSLDTRLIDFSSDYHYGEGYIIQISHGKINETKCIIDVRIPFKEYHGGIVLNSSKEYYRKIPIVLDFENEEVDLEKYHNHKYIHNNFEKIKSWIDENLQKCLYEIQKPITILNMEIDVFNSEIRKLENEIEEEGIHRIYNLKETEIPFPVKLRSEYHEDDEMYNIRCEFGVEFSKVKFSKESESIEVKIKGEDDSIHKVKYVKGIRKCKELDRSRWECEFLEWKEWKKGIITDKNLIEYCENVYSILRRFDDYICKGISEDYNRWGYHRDNEQIPPNVEWGKIYFKMDNEFITEQVFKEKLIYYRNEMVLMNLQTN